LCWHGQEFYIKHYLENTGTGFKWYKETIQHSPTFDIRRDSCHRNYINMRKKNFYRDSKSDVRLNARPQPAE
jgi:hypothetical protein